MSEPTWTGPSVALVTLFDDNGAVRVEDTAAHAARLAAAGMRAILVAGSTGEATALTDAERGDLVGAVRQSCPDVPVVAGATGEWWRPAVARTQAAVKA